MTAPEVLSIRPLTAADAAHWAALKQAVVKQSGAGQTACAHDTAEFEGLTGADAVHQGAFIALLGNRPVGAVRIDVTRGAHRAASAWHMRDLCVLQAHQGRGIGAQLVRAVHETASSTGVLAVYWTEARRHLRPRAAGRPLVLTQKVA